MKKGSPFFFFCFFFFFLNERECLFPGHHQWQVQTNAVKSTALSAGLVAILNLGGSSVRPKRSHKELNNQSAGGVAKLRSTHLRRKPEWSYAEWIISTEIDQRFSGRVCLGSSEGSTSNTFEHILLPRTPS